MDNSSNPFRAQPPPPNYEDEPPSYGYGNGSTIYEENEDYSSHNRLGGPSATMRLLPPDGSNVEHSDGRYAADDADGYTEMYDGSDIGGDYAGNSAQYQAPQPPLQRRQYVKLKTGTPSSSPITPDVVQAPKTSPEAAGASPSVVNKPRKGKFATVEDQVDEFIEELSHSNNVAAKGKTGESEPMPATYFHSLTDKLPHAQQEKQIEENPGKPQPLKAPPAMHNNPFTRKPVLASARINKTDIPSCRTPVRNNPQRYNPVHQNQSSTTLPPSRPTSSLGNPPSFPPPPPSVSDASHRPGSPTRPWTPTRNRPARSLSRTSVNYEPPDLNGSPRPGTPSGGYGGSPRRPLPPAPLFSGPPAAGGEETSIDIGDADEKDDIFGGGGRVVNDNRTSLRSYGSTMSDSTMVTDEKDGLSKSEFDEYEDIDEIDQNVHYGPAPKGRQNRRGVRQAHMTKKEVRLINGELVLECKIPTILHSFLPRRDEREFTHMRYTAVTSDPDDFTVNGYKLRQNIGSTMRETELFICVTMYNENEIDFTRTMHGIMRNITHFCSRNKSRTWGKDGWQKIVVCIIADGRQNVHPRTLNALAAMGVYQDGIAKNVVNQKEVTAHVYEYTSQVSLDSDLKFKGAEKGIVPCQIIFCLKERNQKKLNSHRWFFNAFGRALSPNVCILLDVGTKPEPTALYHLWKAFDQDSNVAGAAGEIKAGKGKGWLGLLNPLVASQNFEYKMSNILDKPLESVFGYITVLPGALSAYRYYALQNDSTGHGPLSQYFKGEMLHGKDADVFTANMYLAEDRILCWELVAKREERWVLKFVKSAVGETDVPDAVPEFISQRRRWLNGAFFAAVYSLIHFRQIWKTDHTIARKILLHIEFIYQFVSLIFTYFSLANFYLTFYFIAGSLTDPKMDPFGHNIGKYIFVILRYSCVLLICLQFILSMGNRPQGARKMFLSGIIVYSVIMMYTTFAALYMVIIQLKARGNEDDDELTLGNNMFTNIIVSTLSTIGLYFLMSFLYLDPWHMFTSSAQYFALLPSYICTLQVYAFCNTHDVTWGTKGDNIINRDLGTARAIGASAVEVEMPSEQLDIDSGYDEALRNLRDRLEVKANELSESQMQEDYYRAVRTYMVAVWMTANAILAMAVSESFGGEHTGDNVYLAVLLWSVASLAIFRGIGSSAFGILGLVHKALEARIKFAAASSGGGTNGLGGSVIGSSSQGSTSTRIPTVGGGGAKNWVRETGWEAKRKLQSLMFWKK